MEIFVKTFGSQELQNLDIEWLAIIATEIVHTSKGLLVCGNLVEGGI